MKFNALSIAFLLIVSTGCSTRLTDFTIMSSKNIDLARGAEFVRSPNRVKGKDTKSIIVFIPTGEPNVKEAMDKAIESTPGAIGLLDGVVTYDAWYIPYIYGESTYTVEGTPLIDPNMNK